MADVVERLILDDTQFVEALERDIKLIEDTSDEFKQLNKDIDKGSQEMAKSVKKGTDEMNKGLDSFEKSMRRNRQELKENIGNSSLFGVSLNDITAKLSQTRTNLDLFRRSLGITSKLTLTQARGIVTLNKNFGVSRGLLKGLAGGFNILRSAIISTGIGALVLGIGSLVTALTSSQQGMDRLAQASSFVGGAFDVVKDKAADLGNELIEAAVNGNFLATSWEKLKGFTKSIFTGEFIKDIKDTTAEMVENGKISARITQDLQVLRREQAALEAESKKLRAEIKELNKTGEDTTKSYSERSEALKEAVSIEQDLIQRRIALAEQELDLIKEKNSLSNSTDADLQNELDKEIEISDLKAESLELQTTLTNKLNTLDQQQLALIQQKKTALDALTKSIFDAAVEANIVSSEEARKQALTDQVQLLEQQRDVVVNLGKSLGVDVAPQLALIDDLIKDSLLSLGEFSQLATRDLPKELERLSQDQKFKITAEPSLPPPEETGFSASLNRYLDEIDNFDDLFNKVLEDIFGDGANQRIGQFLGGVNEAFGQFSNIMGEIGAIAIERNQEQIDLRQEQIDALESQLDRETELQERGLANNAAVKQEEIDKLLAEQQRYERENEKIKLEAQRRQLAIDSVTQAQSLITSSINIIKGFSQIPIVGQALGIAAVTALFAFFAKSKVDAFNATKLSTGADRIDDYFGFADRHGDTDLNGGQGYKVINARTGADTNVRISGKEMLLTEYTSLRHEPFLNELSKGYYDDLDLSKVVGFYQQFSNSVPKNLGSAVSDNKPVQVDVKTAPSKQWVSFKDDRGKTKFILLEVDPDAAPGSVITLN